jgi:magnesium-protoporphyrin O-methyltransferase
MNCCPQCEGVERLFDESTAASELESYRRDGAAKATRLLIQSLKNTGIAGKTLLDIGGGVGAIQHELLKAGASHATNVDASSAYLEAARRQARQEGHEEQISFHHGNFVDLAPEIEPADIVTLDRVICCYHDMPSLVGLSAARARQFYGLIFPRDRWWLKLGRPVFNLLFKLSAILTVSGYIPLKRSTPSRRTQG